MGGARKRRLDARVLSGVGMRGRQIAARRTRVRMTGAASNLLESNTALVRGDDIVTAQRVSRDSRVDPRRVRDALHDEIDAEAGETSLGTG